MAKKKARRRRKPDDKTLLRDKLDDAYSKYVRLSNADECGYCTCISCGARRPWKELDAGHYVGRAVFALRWDDRNVWPQCKQCNKWGGPSKSGAGNPDGYRQGLEAKGIDHAELDAIGKDAKNNRNPWPDKEWMASEIKELTKIVTELVNGAAGT